MSALEAASAGVKDMADGSLRITIEFDPRFAKEAFALFGARGTPLAIAALQVGYASKNDEKLDISSERVQKTAESVHQKPKGGALSKLAGMWCNDPEFWEWINYSDFGCGCSNSNDAAQFIRDICDISSRAFLDSNPQAAEKFNQHIRGPYSKHLIARGITA